MKSKLTIAAAIWLVAISGCDRQAHDDSTLLSREQALEIAEQSISRVLKNSFNPLLVPGHGRPGEIMHVQVLDFESAAKITLFASDVEKSMDGLFQQPVKDRGLKRSDYSLSTYRDPLSANGKEWVFNYELKPAPCPGCFFVIAVDRTTRNVTFVRGE